MRIAIGSDHAGFALKELLVPYVRGLGHEVGDVGAFDEKPVDYPDFAAAVGREVASGKARRGIVICGSGVGASVAANKIRGVRAGLCHDTYSAHQGVEHDDVNVLVLGARIIGSELARELVRAFLGAEFSNEERHVRRLRKVIDLESQGGATAPAPAPGSSKAPAPGDGKAAGATPSSAIEGTDKERMNPLLTLGQSGVSPWLDFIRRHSITSGELSHLVDEDGLCGVTSNPAIFEKAIAGSKDYDNALKTLVTQYDRDAKALYEELAIRDVQDAADVLYSVYERTARKDGYVSLEVSPYLARDGAGTLAEARRLWRAVGRDNLMIKVPATDEGIPVVETLIGEGINVNVTLLFANEYYERVAEAYLRGLETWTRGGGDARRVASVASFFVSRIDAKIDGRLEALAKKEKDAGRRELYEKVMGKIAIANAKLAYRSYRKILSGPRWQALAKKGAMPQRMLWASTSTKNPKYRDVIYVEELIGKDTVNTLPPATFDAFRDHGKVRGASLEEDIAGAERAMADLARAGISMTDITAELLNEGVVLFADAFDRLLGAVEQKRQALLGTRIGTLRYKLSDDLARDVASTLAEWRTKGNVRRLWSGDASLWTGGDEAKWLGWLALPQTGYADRETYAAFAHEVKAGGFRHILLLGMGGSSLCPEVFKLTFGTVTGYPELEVLDSTDPAQIRAFESKIDIKRTLFIVSSKSGSTLEPNIFQQYFYDRARAALGPDEAGKRFIAITDPGSKLEEVARRSGFRRIFSGVASVGGRYSALSAFGLVPLAAMGVDVGEFLRRTLTMVHSCSGSVPPEQNPGVILGSVLGTLARKGRDKLTLVTSPGIYDLGAWLEQLLAESTGKIGRGIIPVDREPLAAPAAYGRDRIFIYTRLVNAPDATQDTRIAALEAAGHPVVRIDVPDALSIGQEFFRWEVATAVAGAVLGIHPFDQPDVEASKIETKKLTDEYERSGTLPVERPIYTVDGISIFADPTNAAALGTAARGGGDLETLLGAFFARLGEGDYFALLGYVPMTREHERAFDEIRQLVRDQKRVATCVGFGPRFLHSTGQAYKGGPNSGVFLQITCEDAAELGVPGKKYTFGIVKAAQAAGDLRVLIERGRRALRVHLPKDTLAGLKTLKDAIEAALAGASTRRVPVETKE